MAAQLVSIVVLDLVTAFCALVLGVMLWAITREQDLIWR